MELLLPFVLGAYFFLFTFAAWIPPLPRVASSIEQTPLKEQAPAVHETSDSLGSWLDKEEKIALNNLLANIAPGGQNVPDAAPGSVIASPSKKHPNYYYQWVRDAAITTGTLVHLLESDPTSAVSENITEILNSYATISHKIQHTSNPSGTFADNLSGLGEPKFHADGSAFKENWGRPQRDGPALRAITLIAYMRAYNETHPSLWVSDQGTSWYSTLYDASLPANSIIKADLEYVSHHWWETGFDLWEEIQGLHFFTAMVQLRALREGVDVAIAFGDEGAAKWYRKQGDELENMIGKFWSEQKGHLVETLNFRRSGLDCGLMLGSLHGTTEGYPSPYPPHSDEVLLSLLELVRDQRHRFPINAAPEPPSDLAVDPLQGVGIGRYPEDEYDGYEALPAGGNPWFLCTSSVAEVLYRTATELTSTSSLHVTKRGLPFWSALLNVSPNVKKDLEAGATYTPADHVFNATVERLVSVADGFMDVVKTHSDAVGSLSEQFDRVNGFERGARDLTWSYGAFLEAAWARKRAP